MPHDQILRLRVTLKGRPVRTCSFSQDVIRIGRDPAADLYLDNPGISREHLRIEATPEGYYQVQDLGSANGTLLNEMPVVRQRLENNDVLRIGKYSLWVAYESERRGRLAQPVPAATGTDDGTTVLTFTELQGMIEKSRISEAAQGTAESLEIVQGGAASGARPRRADLVRVGVIGFLAGMLAGAVLATAAWQGFFRIH